jgi:DNA-binding NarL/FixJ family response regulator
VKRTVVLVADGLSVFRAAVAILLARNSEFEPIEAADLYSVVDVLDDAGPDIALPDLDLAPEGGPAAMRAIAERSEARAIVWSFDADGETVPAAIQAGASGFECTVERHVQNIFQKRELPSRRAAALHRARIDAQEAPASVAEPV